VFGTGLDRYESGLAEGLDLLMGALTQERVSAAGPAFTFREVAAVDAERRRRREQAAGSMPDPAPLMRDALRRGSVLRIPDDDPRRATGHSRRRRAGAAVRSAPGEGAGDPPCSRPR
jgi:hypothetical protein